MSDSVASVAPIVVLTLGIAHQTQEVVLLAASPCDDGQFNASIAGFLNASLTDLIFGLNPFLAAHSVLEQLGAKHRGQIIENAGVAFQACRLEPNLVYPFPEHRERETFAITGGDRPFLMS
jgi:hypothetical protein